MESSVLSAVEAVAAAGKAVISADNSTVVSLIQQMIRDGKSATVYVTPDQAEAIKSWYWTPERVRARELHLVTEDERAKISSELGLEDIGSFYSNRVRCECGQFYGAFEFLQQGIRQHGRETVSRIFALKDSALLRINPSVAAECPHCNQKLLQRHDYVSQGYNGCCRDDEMLARDR
ncbi:hypothetical protein M2163_001005 [Streptomyces sp. SAI-135]|uniref:hypothetical protein n=1 Tax=unclassified Streptomyces TaxID=2593676 RepID=UPI0024730E14|nr:MULTISPECIES: hypothetical protein [unclassified Streptomyces]MDH6522000.1 hypothetical protein [Streptomyces sp. SAI-090]MDH6573369.1 hypothetical protein [Streptomyces sp. SAI-117]MDH6613897.1 hypothetical protein [Streptomyces sp. SAI-135]